MQNTTGNSQGPRLALVSLRFRYDCDSLLKLPHKKALRIKQLKKSSRRYPHHRAYSDVIILRRFEFQGIRFSTLNIFLRFLQKATISFRASRVGESSILMIFPGKDHQSRVLFFRSAEGLGVWGTVPPLAGPAAIS